MSHSSIRTIKIPRLMSGFNFDAFLPAPPSATTSSSSSYSSSPSRGDLMTGAAAPPATVPQNKTQAQEQPKHTETEDPGSPETDEPEPEPQQAQQQAPPPPPPPAADGGACQCGSQREAARLREQAREREEEVAGLRAQLAAAALQAQQGASAAAQREAKREAEHEAAVAKLSQKLAALQDYVEEQDQAQENMLLDRDAKARDLTQQLNTQMSIAANALSKAEKYDQLQVLYSEKEAECQRNILALESLQLALDQFQANQDRLVQQELQYLQQDLKESKAEVASLLERASKIPDLEREIEEQKHTINTLQEEVTSKAKANLHLMEEHEPLRRELAVANSQLQVFRENEKFNIDKRVVKKLIVTYFEKPARQHEVLKLLASILDFEDSDKRLLGLPVSSAAVKAPYVPFAAALLQQHQQQPTPGPLKLSLPDLWVEFLLHEATPTDNL
ncbi:hypothetical protein Pelo_14010 [Pelomyxa schiedti]|nr:hypothetical protein Pelo_14010 [Pelomyxa schiedti]